MNFGLFDRQLVLQRPASVPQDAYGAPAPAAFEDVTTVWGQQKPGIGTEATLGEQLTAQQVVTWQIRYRRDVDKDWQFTCEGRTYQITAVAEIGRRAGLLLTTYYRG
jgi:SPP1 family predicted phage head-tail adaptor